MEIVQREDYLKKLQSLQGGNIIKVVTGVRRCGKSTLLKLFKEELLASGVKDRAIQHINFEEPEHSYDTTWHDVYQNITSNLLPGEPNYIFLDEVQYIPEFERLLIGLQSKDNIDLYVTGSNAKMLSSELATLLSGRSVEISMLPLSFQEYLDATSDDSASKEEKFNNYLSFGGFPQAVSIFEQDRDSIDTYLSGIYETVVGRDIMDRGEVSDKATLNRIVKYLLDNIGSFTSINSIAESLSVSRYKIDQIISALQASFLFYGVGRYDIKGKEMLKTQEKYYAVDMGLRWAMLGRDAAVDMGHILENLVYLELRRRGSKVAIGKVGEKEVDFVVRTAAGHTEYYQVAWSVEDSKTLSRELASLQEAAGYHARYLISRNGPQVDYDGVQGIGIIDWLTK